MENSILKQQVEQVAYSYVENFSYPESLKKAMLYSLKAGGKRIRPLILLETLLGFQGEITKGALEVAAALEMVHTYSLIHDDLPAMDNDDFRRGKPTNHKVFGEALGILAGDGLLTGAFALLGESENSPAIIQKLTALLGKKAGNLGMVSGQVLDLAAENKTVSLEELQEIHRLKTGALISFSFLAGGLLAQQSSEALALLAQVGEHFGLAFQIKDDLLDVEGSLATLGKNPHQDEATHKSTYPKLLGLTGAKKALQAEITACQQGLNALKTQFNFQEENILFYLKALN